MLIRPANDNTGGVANGLPTLIQHTMGLGVPIGTFLRHLKLFRMTIQQDPYDPWWFAPLLYTGAAVVIAAFVLA